jgi:hypothetical protein
MIGKWLKRAADSDKSLADQITVRLCRPQALPAFFWEVDVVDGV